MFHVLLQIKVGPADTDEKNTHGWDTSPMPYYNGELACLN